MYNSKGCIDRIEMIIGTHFYDLIIYVNQCLYLGIIIKL